MSIPLRQVALDGTVFREGSLLATVWRDDEAGLACQNAIEAQLLKNGFTR
jgi:hypothetical protein